MAPSDLEYPKFHITTLVDDSTTSHEVTVGDGAPITDDDPGSHAPTLEKQQGHNSTRHSLPLPRVAWFIGQCHRWT